MVIILIVIFHFGSKATIIQVKDSISTNTHWTNDNQYLLIGFVYVTNGVTLSIDPGTIIKGDKTSKGALIIETCDWCPRRDSNSYGIATEGF